MKSLSAGVLGALAAISLSGCATFGSAPVYGDVPECERLIPDSLKQPVPGVPIPDSEQAEPWMQAFIGQTGALDKANERGPAIDHIYSECLKMHRSALEKAKRKWWQIF